MHTVLVGPSSSGTEVTAALSAGTVADKDGFMDVAANTLVCSVGAITQEQREEIKRIIVETDVQALGDGLRRNRGAIETSFSTRFTWEQLVKVDLMLGYFVGGTATHTNVSGSFLQTSSTKTD